VKRISQWAMLPVLLAVAIISLAIARQAQPPAETSIIVKPYTSTGYDKLIRSMQAGMLPGLGADLATLEIFSGFYQFTHNSKELSQQPLRESIYRSFVISQFLDPQFLDTYRLTEGILAYGLNMPEQAVELLERGSQQLDHWETPFMASFIAYDQLHDLDRAIALAQLAGEKSDVPPLIIGYTARLINNTLGTDFAIKYLEERKRRLHKGYQQGIEKRIIKLKETQNAITSKS